MGPGSAGLVACTVHRAHGWPTGSGRRFSIAGFAVGAVVALLGEPRRVAMQLVGIGEGFAIPLFFVHLGAQIDVGALFSHPEGSRLGGHACRCRYRHSRRGRRWCGGFRSRWGCSPRRNWEYPPRSSRSDLPHNQLTAAQGAAVMAAVLITLAACAAGDALLGLARPLTDASAPIEPA